ncbi:MAG: carboxypeptidase regulatory-like domain-containing protein [Planctomycetes bacterium]|nr:carboxypeptidase regulatory-like domain-containing protein [Planctomycetota bacterium]
MPRCSRFLTLLAALACATSTAGAQAIISGTVLSSNGQPLVGCDIDFYFLNGNEQNNVSGDYTNASGVFTTLIPPGTYNVKLNPSPSMLHQPKIVGPFTVSTVIHIGTNSLVAGAGIRGFLKTTSGLPLANSKITLEVPGSGVPMPTLGGGIDPLTGLFEIVVAPGTYDLFMDTSGDGTLGAPGQILGQTFPVGVFTDLGTLSRPPGFLLSGTVVRQVGGTPVVNCDIDVRDAVTLAKLFTPDDNTNALGFVDVVVPTGNYLVDITPDFVTSLVAQRVPAAVAGPTSFGTVSLEPGVAVQGTVRSTAGTPIAGVDLDAYRWPSQSFVLTANDDTNGSGQYQVILPAGSAQLAFTPVGAPGFGAQTLAPIQIAGSTTVDVVMPLAPAAPSTHSGAGHPGTGGIAPIVEDYGTAAIGHGYYGIGLRSAVAGGAAGLVISEGPGFLPFPDFDVTFHVDMFVVVLSGTFTADAQGNVAVTLPIPNVPALMDQDYYAQWLVLDPGASKFFAHTDALRFVVAD